ncbi:replication protein A 14 kDa subunit [Augochlora pura]
MLKRVDGRHLSQFVGEEVILMGTVEKKSSNGTNIEIRTTDGVQVNVTLSKPVDENAEGYIEVHGILHSKSTMECKSYILVPPGVTDKFDTNQYNELLTMLNVLGQNDWWVVEQDLEDTESTNI